MRKYLLFFILLIGFNPSYGKMEGRPLVDSLLEELNSGKYQKEDTNKVWMLNNISEVYGQINRDSAKSYVENALKLAEKLDFKYGQGICLCHLGLIYSAENYNTELEYYFRFLKVMEQTNNDRNIALALYTIGGAYYDMERWPQTLDYYQKAKNRYEHANPPDYSAIAAVNHSIGAAYLNKGDDKQALAYEFLALKYFEETGDEKRIGSSLLNIGDIYSAMKQYSKALADVARALRMYRSFYSESKNNGHIYGIILSDMGALYLDIANDNASIIEPDSLIPASKSACLKKALQYLTESVSVYKSAGNVPAYTYEKLSLACGVAGNYKGAYDYYRQYIELRDSTFSNSTQMKIATLEAKHETDQKEKQIEINKILSIKRRNESTLYIVSIGLLGIITVLVLRNYSKQKKDNKVKEALLLQKDLLMKEIHHRVKNNLQVISTLLDLGLTNISDEHAKDVMTESTTRVKSISLIHQQLYQTDNITGIEFSKFTKDLLYQVTSVFKKSGQHIVLKNNIPMTILDIDTAVPLGLILNELMTNSYKYAFAGVEEGSIAISLQQKDGHYLLTYKDSGPGLPKGFNMASLKSLGMQVMHDLSIQIGGGFAYVEADKAFAITFIDEAGRRLID